MFIPNNGENYGIFEQDGKIKFMFIDHTPGINGVFSGNQLSEERIKQYSPRADIKERASSYSNLSNLSESHNKWQKFFLAKEVNDRIFNGSSTGLSIDVAIEKAQKDINEIIDEYINNFAVFTTEAGNEIDSQQKLQGYVNKIKKSIDNYRQTEYAKLGGVRL
jgi:hypothetical protein